MSLMKYLFISLLTSLILLSSTELWADPKPFLKFGENPGQLEASYFIPESQTNNLVVLLHGCAQQAGWLANQTGLMKAASEKGFALLLPQQLKSNNIQLCFNWFSPEDQLKGKGETASIVNMINTLKQTYKLENIYLIGLSAGGSMVSSLVAQFPNEIKAASIIAGVGYPCADSLVKALSCMKNGFSYSVEEMVAVIGQNDVNAWPNMILIAGTGDTIVNPKNTEQMAEQWQKLMATDSDNNQSVTDGIAITRFLNTSNKRFIDQVLIKDMGHGWFIDSKKQFGGEAAPFVLESGFSTTDYLVETWEL